MLAHLKIVDRNIVCVFHVWTKLHNVYQVNGRQVKICLGADDGNDPDRRNPCCHPRGSPRPCRDHIGADRCSLHMDRWALCSCLHRRRSTRLHCHRPGTCPGCLPPTHLRTHQFACLSGCQSCGQDLKKNLPLPQSTWTRKQTTSRANCSVLNILLELKLAHWDVRHRLTLASCVCFQ